MYAGLRIGEACAVVPKQVKKEGNNYFINVDRAFSQDGKNLSSPKTSGRVLIPEWLALDILNMKPEDYWQKGMPTKNVTTACFSLSSHGDKIHIKSRQGIYTFVKKDKWKGLIYITSNKLGYDENPIKTTLYNDFKCLAGGIWNFKR